MAPFSMALVTGAASCDFCGASNPTVSYAVDEFGIDYPGAAFLPATGSMPASGAVNS